MDLHIYTCTAIVLSSVTQMADILPYQGFPIEELADGRILALG